MFSSLDTFLINSEVRRQVLRWWLAKLDPGLEDMDPAEVLKILGICTNIDAAGNVHNNYCFLYIISTFRLCFGKNGQDEAAGNLEEDNGHQVG